MTMRPFGARREQEGNMSTKTVKRPKAPAPNDAAPKLPEWRRLCHRYDGDSQRSICGVGIRKPGEDHSEAECRARGHTACVVCEHLCTSQSLSK